MGQLREGMTRSQVEDVLGRPDGYRREGSVEALTYSNRFMSGWDWDKADYHILLTNDRVTAYGAGQIRQAPGVSTLLLVPIR
jgi:hypothetical protein